MKFKVTLAALVLIAVGGVGGLIVSGAFASFVQYSNTMDFCISCHEMESTVYQEYKDTSHYENASGVRAVCADCHVPHHNWIATVWRKVKATKELYYHVTGKLDTEEKFEAHRLELAKGVWAQMEANDSRECRDCHSWEAMVLADQRTRASSQHETAQAEGKTCIDCHKGIAHKNVHEQLEEEEPPPEDFTF